MLFDSPIVTSLFEEKGGRLYVLPPEPLSSDGGRLATLSELEELKHSLEIEVEILRARLKEFSSDLENKKRMLEESTAQAAENANAIVLENVETIYEDLAAITKIISSELPALRKLIKEETVTLQGNIKKVDANLGNYVPQNRLEWLLSNYANTGHYHDDLYYGKSFIDQVISDINGTLALLQTEIDSINGTITILQTEIDAVEQGLADTNTNLSTLQTDVGVLNGNIDALDVRVTALEETGTGGGIDDLNINTGTLAAGQLLVYNGTQWVNAIQMSYTLDSLQFNGTSDIFTLPAKILPGSLYVFLNGLLEPVTQLNDRNIKFIDPPLPGDEVNVRYIRYT